MDIYKNLFRPYFFLQDSEKIHERTIRLLAILQKLKFPLPILQKLFNFQDPRLEIEAFGLKFNNPVGLAAGFDKGGKAAKALACLGFSHLELGTVTPLLQKGNPKPRIFRLVEDQALINRMGFPSGGVKKFVKNLKNYPSSCVIGVNIGKGKDTSLEKAKEDYCSLLENVYSIADYIVINISSPNTIGLRQLQAKSFLKELISEIKKTRESLVKRGKRRKPILLKIAPDLSWKEIDDILEVIEEMGIDGLVATNTTVERKGLKSKNRYEVGGLSGRPLRTRSTKIIRYIHKKTRGKIPIIGVGGVFRTFDVLEKIKAGASLVQVYTGLVYEGPAIVKRINQGLVIYLNKKRIKSIQELVGQDVV